MTTYENKRNGEGLGRLLKRQRLMLSLTLRELTAITGVSASHLGRIERGERFPSASVLRKLARPLDFEESELFALAGYLSPSSPAVKEGEAVYNNGQLDPYVRRVLSQESPEVQRSVLGIISILKSMAKIVRDDKL